MFSANGFATESYTLPDSLGFRKYRLETVRVIASRPEESVGSLSVIDLEANPGNIAMNVKDILQNRAGLSVTTGTKDESNLRIRGFRKEEALILIDGRPINAGYFGNVDLQNMLLSEASAIHILKGPVSSIYGTNTMGGVINLITKDPTDRKLMNLALTAKRNNTNQVELSMAFDLNKWNYWIYCSRQHSDGMVLPASFQPTISENGDVRNNDEKTQYNIQFKADRDILDFHTIGFSAGLTTMDKKLIPCSIYETADYRLYKDWRRFQTSVMGQFRFESGPNLSTLIFLDGAEDTYQQYNDPNYTYLSVDSDMRNLTLGFQPRLDWQISEKHDFTAGVNFNTISNSRKDNGDYPDWTTRRIQKYNAYLMGESRINANLKFSASIGASLADGDLNYSSHVMAEPALGAYYNFSDRTYVAASISINSAYPTMRQLFSLEKGNPDLVPQSALKTEVSVFRPFSFKQVSGSTKFTGFYNKVNDLIDVYNDKYQNIYRLDSYGFEAELTARPLALLSLDCSYGFLAYSGRSDYRLTESPRNSIDMHADIHLPLKVVFGLTAGYKDTRLSQDKAFNYRNLDSYWLFSIFLRKDFGRFKMIAGLENSADTYYEEEYGFPAPGRNYSLRLETEI